MSVGALGFLLSGGLLVLLAIAAVALPSPQQSLMAALAAAIAAAAVLAVAGSWAVALIELAGLVVLVAACRGPLLGQARPLLTEAPGFALSGVVGLAAAVAATIGIALVVGTHESELAKGSHGAFMLVTLIHYREVIGAAAALVVAVVAAAVAVGIGRESADEQRMTAAREHRRRRTEATQRRRADREAARRQRRGEEAGS